MAKSTAVLRPNLGLVLNQAPIAVPDGALQDGHNFRITNGALNNLNLGWSDFGTFTLGTNVAGTFTADPVTLIYNRFDRASAQQLVFGTTKDLFLYVDDDEVDYLTPRYATGTVDVSTEDGAVVTEASGTTNWSTNGIKAGDYIHFGNAAQTDPTAVWYEIESVDAEDTLTLTGLVSGAPLVGQTYTIRRTFTATLSQPWSAATFLHEADADDDLTFFTNGVDDIYKWDGDTTQVEDASFSFKAFHLTVFKNMLIASACTDTGEFLPGQVRNSKPGDPLDFTTGLASAFTVHDGSDPVSAAMPLGDSLALYSSRHIVMADFVGDPFVFVLRTATSSVGPLAGRLVADYGDYHTFIGADGQYAFDGVALREIGNQVWRSALRQRDPQRTARSFSFFDEENGELLWAVPFTSDEESDGPERAYVDNYLEAVEQKGLEAPISSRDLPFTTAGYYSRQATLTWDDIADTWQELNFRWNDIFFQAAFPFTLVGDTEGKLYTLGTSQLGGGADLTSFVRFGRRPTVDGRQRGLIARIYPFAARFTQGDLMVRLRLVDSANGRVTVADEQSFDQMLGEDGHFVSPFRTTRFYEIEFGTSGDPWEVAGYDLDIRPGGGR